MTSDFEESLEAIQRIFNEVHFCTTCRKMLSGDSFIILRKCQLINRWEHLSGLRSKFQEGWAQKPNPNWQGFVFKRAK